MKTTTNPKTAKRAEIRPRVWPVPGHRPGPRRHLDGRNIWFARGEKLAAIDLCSGELVRQLDIAADAGTAFDGKHLWQIAKTGSRRWTQDGPRPGQAFPRRHKAATRA